MEYWSILKMVLAVHNFLKSLLIRIVAERTRVVNDKYLILGNGHRLCFCLKDDEWRKLIVKNKTKPRLTIFSKTLVDHYRELVPRAGLTKLTSFNFLISWDERCVGPQGFRIAVALVRRQTRSGGLRYSN